MLKTTELKFLKMLVFHHSFSPLYFLFGKKKQKKMEKEISIGQMAIIAAKNQNSSVQVFKKPQPVQKIKKRKVILNEESYLQVNFKRL